MMITPEQIAEFGHGGHHHGGGGGVKPIPTIVPTPNEYQYAGEAGFRTLWVVFVIMAVASAVFTVMAWRVPVARRLYYVLTTLITVTAAISYFAMASGFSTTFHCTRVKDHHGKLPSTHHHLCREVLPARYIDWLITTPLLLLDLCLLAGLDGASTLTAVVADFIMVLTGLFAAYGREHTPQKWGWFTIACLAYLVVVWQVPFLGIVRARAKSNNVAKAFGSIATFTFIIWTVYPIVWGFADGARKMSVNQEIIAYAILDVLAKPIFGIWLLISHRRIPETNIDIGGYWSQGLSSEGRIRIGDDDEGA